MPSIAAARGTVLRSIAFLVAPILSFSLVQAGHEISHRPALEASADASPASGSADEHRRIDWSGDGANAALGTSIGSEACDVNGDGIDDVVVSSWLWSGAERPSSGALYVIFGSDAIHGGNLGADYLDTGSAVRVDGPEADSEIGFSIDCLGDVNGDGIDDFGVGSDVTQRAYVIFGATNFARADLADLGNRGFVVRGDEASGHFGHRIAGIGDVNNDGKAEIAVSALDAGTNGRSNNGRVWVIAGTSSTTEVNLADPEQANDSILFTVDGAANLDRLTEVSNIGDFNGDGVPDLLIGSQWQRVGTGANAGRAFVIWGGNEGAVDLAALGDRGISIEGPTRGRDRFGISISSAGDVDGDGLSDLLIGAQGSSALPGGVAVVFGKKDDQNTIHTNPLSTDLSVFSCAENAAPIANACPDGSAAVPRGYWIDGANGADLTSADVAGIGDVNDDDVPDFAISAKGYDSEVAGELINNSGAVWVVYGKSDFHAQQLSQLTSAEANRIDGTRADEAIATSLGTIGDVDGNGTVDIAYSSNFAARPLENPAANAGELSVQLMGELVTQTELEVPASAEAGSETLVRARVSTLAAGSRGVQAGAIEFSHAGEALVGCEAVKLEADGTAECAVVPGVHAAAWEIAGRYLGLDSEFAASTSESAAFRVDDTSTTVLSGTWPAEPRAGEAFAVYATVRASHGTSTPAGTVAFSINGETLPQCASVPLQSGTATCPVVVKDAQTLHLGASFTSEESTLADSVSSQLELVIGAAEAGGARTVPSIAAVVADSTRSYGSSFTVRAAVQADAAPATGIVRVSAGSKTLATGVLKQGRVTIRVPSTALKIGKTNLMLSYLGSDTVATGKDTIRVTVSKATTKVRATLSTPRLTAHKAPRITVQVSPNGSVNGSVKPTGKITVRVKGKVVKTVKLRASRNGKVTFSIPKLKAGKYSLTVRYSGDSRLKSATRKVTVRVR